MYIDKILVQILNYFNKLNPFPTYSMRITHIHMNLHYLTFA